MQNTDQLLSIGDFLIKQFKVHGISHVFGIPGDYILSFYSKMANSPIKIINTCDEQGAGFAADAYAPEKQVTLSSCGFFWLTFKPQNPNGYAKNRNDVINYN